MKVRYCVAALAATLCLVVASSAFAAKPAPTPQATIEPGAPVIKVNPEAATTACELGVVGPPVEAVGYILPPDDNYYTLLKGADCPECEGEPRAYTFAHVGLYFVTHCATPVTVSIVGSTGGACPTPDPSVVLCPPRTYLIDSAAMGIPLGVPVDITLPLTAGCCLQGDVFLRVEYDQGTCNFNNLGFLTDAPPCSGCTQYNVYAGGSDDVCTAIGPFGYGLFLQSAEVECCGGTATESKSWGGVKGMYR